MANGITLDSMAEFTWDFGNRFLLKCNNKYYVWSDPYYKGDNTIRPYSGNPLHFTTPGFAGRSKGMNLIRNKCGDQVKFIDC